MKNDYFNKNINLSKDKIDRPYLIYRMFAGIIDFMMMILLFVGCYFLFKVSFYKGLGYYDSLDSINDYYDESCLFDKEGESFIEISFEEPTNELLDNVDSKIIYFYSNNEFAVNDNKLNTYNQNKIDNSVENLEIDEASVFYEEEYNKAVEYFKETDTYVINNNILNSIILGNFLIDLIVSSSIIYLVFPLIIKTNNTLGQHIFNLYLINNESNKKINKSQIIYRYLSHVSINYLLPIVLFLYLNLGIYSFIPFIINIFLMCLTKQNYCLTDYISNSSFVTKAYYKEHNI